MQISLIRDGRLVDRIVLDKNPTAGIPIPAIFEDKDGAIWIGAATDSAKAGLYRFANGQQTLYRTTEGLVDNNVRRIMQDSHGALWIGTYGGLSVFKDGKFTNYTTENGLTHNYVREIYEASDRAIWLGTYGGGLLRLKDGKFVAITTRDGLFDNIVSRILEDDRGNFWMSCNRGIFRVSHKELDDFADGKIASVNSVNYGVADGMKSSECNGGFQPAGWKARDGTLWFPTQKGVAAVDPSQISTIPPSVAVDTTVLITRVRPLLEKNSLHVPFTIPVRLRTSLSSRSIVQA